MANGYIVGKPDHEKQDVLNLILPNPFILLEPEVTDGVLTVTMTSNAQESDVEMLELVLESALSNLRAGKATV